MHCYLHIGTEKTGTTLIQDFLHLNAEKLESLGLGYLRSASYANNRWLVVAAADIDRRDRWTESRSVFDDEAMHTLQQSIIQSMQAELITKKIQALVVSSEHIQSRLTRVSEIARLKNILKTLGVTSFSVIVYLRDPVEVAASLYSTAVKCGSTSPAPAPPTAPSYAQVCNHQATLEKFKSVFNAEGDYFFIRLFVRSELKKSSVLEDFLAILGIDDLSDFQKPQAENKSLSRLGIELLRRINMKIPNLNESESIEIRKVIIEDFDRNFTDDKYIMPAKISLAYSEAFKASNEWVRAGFFKNKQYLFKEKIISEENTVNFKNSDLDKITQLFIDGWVIEKS